MSAAPAEHSRWEERHTEPVPTDERRFFASRCEALLEVLAPRCPVSAESKDMAVESWRFPEPIEQSLALWPDDARVVEVTTGQLRAAHEHGRVQVRAQHYHLTLLGIGPNSPLEHVHHSLILSVYTSPQERRRWFGVRTRLVVADDHEERAASGHYSSREDHPESGPSRLTPVQLMTIVDSMTGFLSASQEEHRSLDLVDTPEQA